MKKLLILLALLIIPSAAFGEIQMSSSSGSGSVAYHKNSSGTLSAVEVSGTLISTYHGSSTIELDLPAIASTYYFVVTLGTAYGVSIDPNGTDQVYLDGTALTAGNKVSSSTNGVGNSISCYVFSTDGGTTNKWSCNSGHGTWADGGA